MSADIKYPIADLDGSLVWASELAISGQRPAGLQCVGCTEPVVLHSGQKNQPHFAHLSSTLCSGGESALHRTAIRIIAEGVIAAARTAKPYPFEVACSWCDVVRTSDLARDRSVTATIDQPFVNGVRPDVLFTSGDGTPRYAIEVVVTHAPDESSLAVYRASDLPIIAVYPSWATIEKLRWGLTDLVQRTDGAKDGAVELLRSCTFPRHIEPEQADLQPCPECGADSRLVTVEVSVTPCWSKGCSRQVRILDIYASLDGRRTLIAAGSRELKGTAWIAKKFDVRLELRRSSAAGTNYTANICECGALSGDNFVYGGLRGPVCTPLPDSEVRRYSVCVGGHWTKHSTSQWPKGVRLGRPLQARGLIGEVSGVLPSFGGQPLVTVTHGDIREISQRIAGTLRSRR